MIRLIEGVEYLDYDQAAIEYGFSRSTIPSMVTHGDFINRKFPRDRKAYISRPQLEAYRNKRNGIEPSTQLNASNNIQDMMRTSETPYTSSSTPLFSTREMLENNLGVTVKRDPTTGEPSFTYAQTDENNKLSGFDYIVILFGLIFLFFGLSQLMKKEAEKFEKAKEEAEKELKETGLKGNDLILNFNKNLGVLKDHPKQAIRLKYIMKENNVPTLVA